MQQPNTTPTAEPANTPPASAGPCENCGAPLYGKYCYACGQPTHGLVRHFSSVLADVADSVLNIDERVFRTLAPLYLRPGKLTLDYFAGKRARYVTPFRMVFFLAIVAFFSVQLGMRAEHRNLESAMQLSGGNGATAKSSASASASASASPAEPAHADRQDQTSLFEHGNITINDHVIWNRSSHPLTSRWLPDIALAETNDLIGNAQQQMHQMNSGSYAQRQDAAYRFMLGMAAAAPTVLFVLLPVFALMLKLFFIFKRRLYMEHLIVAMHSHAFLLLSMLVLLLLGALRGWLVPHAGWLGIPFGLATAAAWLWMFAYLLIMQKRVYRQGWWMTCFKFCWIGSCYGILLFAGFIVVALMSLTGA